MIYYGYSDQRELLKKLTPVICYIEILIFLVTETHFHVDLSINQILLSYFFFFFFLSCRGTIELGDITSHNIKQLKRLNQVVFPVTYNDKFYKDVLEVGELAKLGKKKTDLP